MSQASLPTTNVDPGELEWAITQLQQLQQFIEQKCIGSMPAIHDALGAVSNINQSAMDYKFTRDATVFGGFYSAYGIQARNDGVYRAVEDSLKEMLDHIKQVIEVTQTIIANYRAAEQRNVDMGADIQRALLGQTTIPPNA